MNRDEILAYAREFTSDSPSNHITEELAVSPNCVGLRMFEPPVFAFGSPDDELYDKFKSPEIIGGHFIAPGDWLPGAKTVIAFFLPYTDKIKSANSIDRDWPAEEWLHGRYEGQMFLKELAINIQKLISDAGYTSLTPAFDARFKSGNEANIYTSNWSERHVAFACGLGTFGLSTGLITEKGVCGRFGSVLTVLDLPKDVRKYSDVLEYCTMCGACIKKCPADAISLEGGKKHPPCEEYVNKTLDKHRPRYGCGKCQVRVPCESAIPRRKAR